MYLQALLFSSGVLLRHADSLLGGSGSWLVAVPALLVLRWRSLLFLLLGYAWTAVCIHQALAWQLAPALEGRDILVSGTVLDVPAISPGQARRLVFSIEHLDSGTGWQDFHGKALLRWYEPAPALASGERWRLQVRLKRAHGFANPGGFDYERWLFQQGIRLTGYVRADGACYRTGEAQPGMLQQFRQKLLRYFSGQRDDPSAALLQALTIGERGSISREQWQVLNNTGTTHLLAISGLHISLVAGLVYWLVRSAWRRSIRLGSWLPAVRAATLLAVIAAAGYALLSGFGIPARRALLMTGVVMCALYLNRTTGFLQLICLAAGVTLLYDPFSVLAPGWWLSFWAVLLIAWMAGGRVGRRCGWRKLLTLQLALALGMLPLMLLMFQRVSLVAPVANLLAVPLIGMLVVPLALTGVLVFAFHVPAGGWLLELAGHLLNGFWPVLGWLGRLDHASWSGHDPLPWTVLPAIAGIALLLAPRGIPARWVGAVLLLPLLSVQPARPGRGAMVLTLLDVGQGLAAVVQTRNHALVFDTGPRFSDDFDAGQAVIVPYLRSQGIGTLDVLVISHGDNDHIGGAQSLAQSYPPGQVLSSVPGRLSALGAHRCHRGMQWEWDGVRFSILHPEQAGTSAGNNDSCVLHIRTPAGGSVLLTGDIEQQTEWQLLRTQRESLAAGVLVVPHHGSKTSSTPAFVRAVAPHLALVPAGYLNRYRLPAAPVVERYLQAGIRLLDTGHAGAIRASFSTQDDQPVVTAWRRNPAAFWQWQD